MTIEERYDGIYSNKVLYHLTREELKISLENQAQALKTDGIMIRSGGETEKAIIRVCILSITTKIS